VVNDASSTLVPASQQLRAVPIVTSL
jgi:hypothetical protein